MLRIILIFVAIRYRTCII